MFRQPAQAARQYSLITPPRNFSLLRFTRDSGNLIYCVSPDLPDGQVATVFDGDIEPEEFSTAFDDLMVRAVEDT